jgi:hypothetical protein
MVEPRKQKIISSKPLIVRGKPPSRDSFYFEDLK